MLVTLPKEITDELHAARGELRVAAVLLAAVLAVGLSRSLAARRPTAFLGQDPA